MCYFLRLILLTLFLSYTMPGFGHQDRYHTFEAGNVTLTILTGFQYEEITKSALIAEQANDFLATRSYQNKVVIDFHHNYVTEGITSPQYFVSVDAPEIMQPKGNDAFAFFPPGSNPEKRTIYIRIIADQFPLQSILKAISFAIDNRAEIKACQQQYRYSPAYSDWIIYSLAPAELAQRIDAIPRAPLYAEIEKKYYADPQATGLSYYIQRDSFYLFFKNRKEHLVKTSDRLFQIEAAPDEQDFGLFFPDSKSFWGLYLLKSRNTKTPELHQIPHGDTSFRPFDVQFIGEQRALIRHSFYGEHQRDYLPGRELLYLHRQQVLIDDFGQKILTLER